MILLLNTLLLASVTLLPVAAATEPTTATLTLNLRGFQRDDGQVLVAVYRGADGFPGQPNAAWQTKVARVRGGQAQVILQGVPVGEYAVAVVHDENNNNKLDTNWLGMPREGIGMSNNARGRLGPPKYRDAKFGVTQSSVTQTITMVYL